MSHGNRQRRLAPRYTISQKVWLSSWDSSLQTICRKLTPLFHWPFPHLQCYQSQLVCLNIPPPLHCIHPVLHVSRVKPCVSSSFSLPASVSCQVLALVFPSYVLVFMLDLCPNTPRVCVAPFGYFRVSRSFSKSSFSTRFLRYSRCYLICIIIISPVLCRS